MLGLTNWLDGLRARARYPLDGEPVVREGPANYLRRWEGVGGWLALSPHWLVFVAHRFNCRSGRLLLPVASIRSVSCCWAKLFGVPIVPNAIAVRTREGREYRFVVNGRRQWVRAISRQRFPTDSLPPPNEEDN
jgi:hypothetical protein